MVRINVMKVNGWAIRAPTHNSQKDKLSMDLEERPFSCNFLQIVYQISSSCHIDRVIIMGCQEKNHIHNEPIL